MALLPVADTPPPPFSWARHRYELWHHVQREDDPTQFLRWSTVEGTMVVGDVPHIREELEVLKAEVPNWRNITKATGFGGERLLEDDISPNLVHQAYHLHVFKNLTGRSLRDMDTIIEIGGGFGAMAVAAHRFGFRGVYYIYDLPEFSLLQEYYLNRVAAGAYVKFATIGEDIPDESDLLVGMWSLGEMPTGERERVLDFNISRNYLLAYMPDFGGGNNKAWFHDYFVRYFKNYRWFETQAACSSMYLIGAREL